MDSSADLCLYEDEGEISDQNLLVAYNELRHREKIEGSKKGHSDMEDERKGRHWLEYLFLICF